MPAVPAGAVSFSTREMALRRVCLTGLRVSVERKPGGLMKAQATCIVRTFFSVPMPWDKKRKEKEEGELGMIRSFGKTCSVLDGQLALPEDSILVKWLDETSAMLPKEGMLKEDFRQWLTAGENEASALAKDKMGAFQRTDWLQESSADEREVHLALHYTALAHLFSELKKNKAVFKPQHPGESITPDVPEKVIKTIRAYIKGSQEDRIKGFWQLVDESPSGDGLLTEQLMDDAIYAALTPAHLTVSMVYPALPSTNKAQKKAFAKFIKWYMRDEADYPTRLRCIYAWAEKQGDVPNQRISFEAYMKTQSENFADLHNVGNGSMELYSRVRAAAFAQKEDDRETFRLGILFYIALTATDVYVSML